MRQLLLRACCLLAGLAFVYPCYGWGRDGHMIIAYIAAKNLTPEARTEVDDLLGDQSLVQVSNWADEIKSDKSYRWASALHYANVKEGSDSFDLDRDCPEHGCVVSAVIKYESILRDKGAGREQRIEALKFLVHFVGDIHQPMHVSRKRDRGGNDIKVTFFHDRTNLHRVWDTALIRRQKKKWQPYAVELMESISSADRQQWASFNPSQWATESYKLAISHAYPIPKSGELGEEYLQRNTPVFEEQLQKAGIRLALLLNGALPPADVRQPEPTPVETQDRSD